MNNETIDKAQKILLELMERLKEEYEKGEGFFEDKENWREVYYSLYSGESSLANAIASLEHSKNRKPA